MRKPSDCQTRTETRWRMLCASAESDARQMGLRCIRSFADLMQNETRKFCAQSPPASDAELGARQAQALALTARIGAIAHASAMAMIHPTAIAEILQLVKAFCGRLPLTRIVSSETSDLMTQIGAICHTDAMRRLAAGEP